jgi:hypothetical protein
MTLLNAGKATTPSPTSTPTPRSASTATRRGTAVYVWQDATSFAIVSREPLSGPESLAGKSFGTTGQSAGRKIVPYVLSATGSTRRRWTYRLRSSFLITQTRSDLDYQMFTGTRDDRLRPAGDTFVIASRSILIDQTAITSTNLSIFF